MTCACTTAGASITTPTILGRSDRSFLFISRPLNVEVLSEAGSIYLSGWHASSNGNLAYVSEALCIEPVRSLVACYDDAQNHVFVGPISAPSGRRGRCARDDALNGKPDENEHLLPQVPGRRIQPP